MSEKGPFYGVGGEAVNYSQMTEAELSEQWDWMTFERPWSGELKATAQRKLAQIEKELERRRIKEKAAANDG